MQSAVQHTDEFLMERVCQNDKMALELLYNRYFKRLQHFASNIYQLDDTADLVQDTFIKLYEKPHQYDKRYPFKTWIYQCLSNRCKNELRNRQTRIGILNKITDGKTPITNSHTIENKEIRLEIRQAIQNLSEKERTIYALKFEHELSNNEIAEILDIPLGTVKSALFNLLAKLRTYLSPLKNEK